MLLQKIQDKEAVIGVVGLGYVGLPLAVEFGKQFKTLGFDISQERINELNAGIDHTLECSSEQLSSSTHLNFSTDQRELEACEIYIITVPTPIDQNKTPDLRPLIGASKTVGKVLQHGNLVIYESTVYPGCTEEDCVPVLERESGLTFNSEFFCGYSPERINPGDKEHTVTKILKVTSGSTPEVGEIVDDLYKSIITAGTHLAPSIKVAEAAKVIENSQRDINIAFVNELSMIFHRIGIDTNAVLEAAGTKWNFLPFRPGLVGGHCIGVDPYYLTQRAKQFGYHPEIILAGRRLNDNMGKEVAQRVIKLMINQGHRIKGSKVILLGITFKENCPDIRTSRVVDVIQELEEFGCNVAVYDPWADPKEVMREYDIELLGARPTLEDSAGSDAVVVAVAHDQFKELDYSKFSKDGCVLFDLKSLLPEGVADERL
ncbi:nucleotide sugar dehydrogenase [Akkermansiaceae bacterium]|nr:nucleotide sugar dehydrogenase [Akkermansiaceae bacterium]MDB4377038.1 nucleotide sugar dehydrogenase [Akkermansiaceae bacterium]